MKAFRDEEWYKIYREQHPAPYFNFPAIPAYGAFEFERLTLENFQQLYLMFEGDDSVFTEKSFTTYTGAKEYATYITQYGAYSPKHGGCDWFFKIGDEYIGILHLYDLSLETFSENNKQCWIGFAIKQAERNKGITKQVLKYFIQYIFANYPIIWYIHSMTLPGNIASKALLNAVGFQKDDTERVSKNHVFYILEKAQQG